MKIVTCVFLAIVLIVSFGIWKLSQDTRLLTERVRNTQSLVDSLKKESKDIAKYKDGQGLSLDKFYLETFNTIKEISFYYHVPSEIKIVGAKDFANLSELFKPSQYRGIKYMDALCQIGLKDPLDICLFETLYRIMKNKPLEILDAKIENDVLSLTMRLYGT